MTNPSIGDLFDRKIIQENPLATVMPDCLVIRHPDRQSHTIVALSDVWGLQRILTTHPALLVVSSGFFLVSAAAFSSKDSSGTAWPAGLLGLAFAAGYLLSRKAALSFLSHSGPVQTGNGSLRDVANLIGAIKAVQARCPAQDP